MLAPSGSPIKLTELGDWLGSLVTGRNKCPELQDAITQAFGVKHCLMFSTGRAAMCFLFRCLQKYCNDEQRDEVVVPGYTCYSVASSAVMAGLKIRVCDIDPVTLSYDIEQLESVDFSRVLCVVTANLYGMPDDLYEIERIAREKRVFLVDDAAQSLGASVNGRYSGTFGIAGLYSLDKGKNITSIQGGMIVTESDDLASIMHAEYRELGVNSRTDNIREYIKLIVYFIFLHPALYWIPARAPFIGLGETRYEDDYPVHRYPVSLSPIAIGQLNRLESITGQRALNARNYQESLPDLPSIQIIQPLTNTRPAWLRFPLRITDSYARDTFLAHNTRMGCTGSYPKSIAEIPEIREHIFVQNDKCDVAVSVAREIVTLPTHAYVTESDISKISRSLRTIVTAENASHAANRSA